MNENTQRMTLAQILNSDHRDRMAVRPVRGSIAFFDLSSINPIDERPGVYWVSIDRRYPYGISHHRGGVYAAKADTEFEVIVRGGNPDGTWFIPTLHRGEVLGYRIKRGGQGVTHVQEVTLEGPLGYAVRNLCGSSMPVVYALEYGRDEAIFTDEDRCRQAVTEDISFIDGPVDAEATCRRCAQRYERKARRVQAVSD